MPESPEIDPRTHEPVERIPSDRQSPRELEDGIALCLSGGGYRAMLFHVGALWRLHETGILPKVERISSVSGGSIAAVVLALGWDQLYKDGKSFEEIVVEPLRQLSRRTIDLKSVTIGALLPGVTIADRIEKAYRKHLFKGKKLTLQDLPDHPRFVINATNVQSGALWRFSKPYMRDWRVGEVKNPTVQLARAVAASSAFPPILSPVVLDLDPADFTPNSGTDLQQIPFTSRVVLSDGGVYDNLGLETAFKRYKTVLVSDGGGQLEPEGKPKEDWALHSYRVLNLIDDQVRSLRKRQLIGSLGKSHTGAYWGIRTEVTNYPLSNPLDCPPDRTLKLAQTPTRLKRLKAKRRRRLINWGYAVCDTAIRAHVDTNLPRPADFPYPDEAV